MDARQRVLIAESDEGLRRALQSKLVDLNVESEGVVNGRDAIAQLASQTYAVIVLDLSLEIIDSSRVLDHIQQMPSERRPIVIAVAAPGILPALDADIVQMIVRKPFKAYEIGEVIRDCLRCVQAESRFPGSRDAGRAGEAGAVDQGDDKDLPRRPVA